MAMALAVALGPLPLVVRAGLRRMGGRRAVTRWQRAAVRGLGLGLVAAPALAGATLGGEAAIMAAVLGLGLLLFAQDLAWRWLPLEWSLPLLALGLLAAYSSDMPADGLAGAVFGAGFLWALQRLFRLWRGVEALGTGDIWLAAAVGAFGNPTSTALILGLAALTGLADATLRRLNATSPVRRRWGVAYGSHVIAVFFLGIPCG